MTDSDNYRKALFGRVAATGEETGRILLEIAGFAEGERFLRVHSASSVRISYRFSPENAESHPDFIITSSFLENENGRQIFSHAVKYDPESVSPIYISALEERLRREGKMVRDFSE